MSDTPSPTRRRFKGADGKCDPECVRFECSPLLVCLVLVTTPAPGVPMSERPVQHCPTCSLVIDEGEWVTVHAECAGVPSARENAMAAERDEARAALERTLRAICLIRDYFGAKALPAIKGWEWYDAGMIAAHVIPDSQWAADFALRIAPTEDPDA